MPRTSSQLSSPSLTGAAPFAAPFATQSSYDLGHQDAGKDAGLHYNLGNSGTASADGHYDLGNSGTVSADGCYNLYSLGWNGSADGPTATAAPIPEMPQPVVHPFVADGGGGSSRKAASGGGPSPNHTVEGGTALHAVSSSTM